MLFSIFLHGTTFYLTFLGEVSCENGETVYESPLDTKAWVPRNWDCSAEIPI